MVIALPVYIIVRIIFTRIKHTKKNIPREFVLALFCIFSFALAIILIRTDFNHGNPFNILDGVDEIKSLRSIEYRVNYIPLKTIGSYILNPSAYNDFIIYENLFGNVLIFLPIGFAMPLLWKHWQRFYRIFLFGLLAPVAIEIIQLFTGRSADIDDVILNCLGVLVGYLSFQILNYIVRIFPRLSA